MSIEAKNTTSTALSQSRTDNVAFEVRYDASYLIWDRAGRIWADLKRKFQDIQVVDANPVSQTFKWKNKYTLMIGANLSSVTSVNPDPELKEFTELAETLLQMVITHLEVDIFTRVGFRRGYFDQYETREDAIETLLAVGVLIPPKIPNFGLSVEAPVPEYSLRWEGENIGANVRVKVENRKFEMELPPELEEVKVPVWEKTGLVYDVDYYTRGTVKVDQFRASDWLKNAVLQIKNESVKYIGGLK